MIQNTIGRHWDVHIKKKKKMKKLNVKAQNPILLQQLARAKGGDIFSPQEYFQELHL